MTPRINNQVRTEGSTLHKHLFSRTVIYTFCYLKITNGHITENWNEDLEHRGWGPASKSPIDRRSLWLYQIICCYQNLGQARDSPLFCIESIQEIRIRVVYMQAMWLITTCHLMNMSILNLKKLTSVYAYFVRVMSNLKLDDTIITLFYNIIISSNLISFCNSFSLHLMVVFTKFVCNLHGM